MGDDCADAQCKGRGDPPVELGNLVGGITRTRRNARHEATGNILRIDERS